MLVLVLIYSGLGMKNFRQQRSGLLNSRSPVESVRALKDMRHKLHSEGAPTSHPLSMCYTNHMSPKVHKQHPTKPNLPWSRIQL